MTNETDFYINEGLSNAYRKNMRYTVAHGGRGGGKSLQFGAIVIQYALQNPGSRILCVRGTQNKISESSLQILKDVIEMLNLDSYFDITEHTLHCKNGSEFLFYGAKNPSTFKSLQGIDFVFIDEATELSEKAWEYLVPTIRSDESKFVVSFNPENEDDPVWQMFIANIHPDAAVVEINYPDNPYFPLVLRREMEYDKSRNYQKYLWIWEGKLKTVVEGALWNTSMICYDSSYDIEDFEKIVVAIDPSVTSKSTSDACGIVVAGKVKGKDLYIVLEDLTKVMTPNEWANMSIAAYDKFKANKIIYESNQGGDIVKTVIKNKRNDISVTGVHASRGKILRAEPVAALYEDNKVLHDKHYVDLEYEMLTYTGAKTDKSPNRLDALVYAIMELNKTKSNKNGLVRATGRLR